MFKEVSQEEDRIGREIVNASFHVHKELGEAQLLSHLKLTNKRLGYLINFNVSLIKYGIKRMVI
jgi:hypothetical protein